MEYSIGKDPKGQLRASITIQRKGGSGKIYDVFAYSLSFGDLIDHIDKLIKVKDEMTKEMLPKNTPTKSISCVLGNH